MPNKSLDAVLEALRLEGETRGYAGRAACGNLFPVLLNVKPSVSDLRHYAY
jgi:hypothetical protein